MRSMPRNPFLTLDGATYLVVVDRYSGWPLVQPLKKLDTSAVTATLEDWFLDYGKPVSIRSDGGPQFRSEFIRWCEDQNIVHQLSSAYHHESNGHAEVAVREPSCQDQELQGLQTRIARVAQHPALRRALSITVVDWKTSTHRSRGRTRSLPTNQ